jgi:3-methyladenine DNA glycosylase AlkC
MAEPLKNQYGAHVPKTLAAMIKAVYPQFKKEQFIRSALNGYEELELMPRARKIADVLNDFLPSNYNQSAKIIIDSLGAPLSSDQSFGMQPFIYLPYVFFVSKYGLDHFDISMKAQYELTKRFTAEFSIRSFIEKYPQRTLKVLKIWAKDPNYHVRRLVSEGTRPRLPWASRLRIFQQDPSPILPLLEVLKNDPELYVRRSVANNLNDIGKDNPNILFDIASRWMQQPSTYSKWIINHALRSSIKQANPKALKILGFNQNTSLKISNKSITPTKLRIGQSVKITFTVTNHKSGIQKALIDLRIYFVKSNGKASAKVFKLKSILLDCNESISIKKTISLRTMTTRKHYPGAHKVELIINGSTVNFGQFDLKT